MLKRFVFVFFLLWAMANGNICHSGYATDGTLRSVNNALGETVLTFSDKIGRMTNQVFADANALNLAYDRSSDPIKYILPHGTEHQYGYNPVGLTERYSSPSVDSVPTNTAWHYNAARQLDYLVKPDGTVISNVYDFAGRLIATRAEKNGAIDEISYTYDGAGRLETVNRSGNAIQYSYDAFLQTAETTPFGTISREYNDDFRVTSLTLAGVLGVSYSYDDDGLLTQAGDISLNRDPTTGFLIGTTLGGVTDQRSYNGFGEVNNYMASVSGNPIYSVAYGYDALGRITNQAETVGGTSVVKAYTYDNRGRLTQVTTNGIISESYAYDANGNALTRYASRFTNNATYDSQDRLLTYGDLACQYAANGEQTNRIVGGQTTSLAYDLFGQLSSVSLPDGRNISYDRDALGRITAKRVNGAVVKGWIYKDGLKPIAEIDSFGNISVFVYGSSPLTPDYMLKGGNTYRLIRDHVGSIRLVVDTATGAIAQRLDYDSFGNVLADTNPGFQPFGFQSGLYDSDTGFVQFGARWYDPLTGRWLSKDSLLLAAGWNVYAFCANDPVNKIDFLGLSEDMPYDLPISDASLDWIMALTPLKIPFAAGIVNTGIRWLDDVLRAAKGAIEGTKVYRVWGGKAGPWGESWTTIKPNLVPNFRSAAGLPDVNSGRFVSEGVLKTSEGVTTRGSLVIKPGQQGGLPEVVIKDAEQKILLQRISGVSPEF